MASFNAPSRGILDPDFDFDQAMSRHNEEHDLTSFEGTSSPPYLVDGIFGDDSFDLVTSSKRQRVDVEAGIADPIDSLRLRRSDSTKSMSPVVEESASASSSKKPAAAKSKRVRTGCLTCRERHLKCDEAVPECLNCRKSNRECKRGVRLNFIDVQVRDPPLLPPTEDWSGMYISQE